MHIAIVEVVYVYGRTFIFVENFYVNNLSVVLEIFHVFNFRGTRESHENYLTSNISRFTVYHYSYHWYSCLPLHVRQVIPCTSELLQCIIS